MHINIRGIALSSFFCSNNVSYITNVLRNHFGLLQIHLCDVLSFPCYASSALFGSFSFEKQSRVFHSNKSYKYKTLI